MIVAKYLGHAKIDETQILTPTYLRIKWTILLT